MVLLRRTSTDIIKFNFLDYTLHAKIYLFLPWEICCVPLLTTKPLTVYFKDSIFITLPDSFKFLSKFLGCVFFIIYIVYIRTNVLKFVVSSTIFRLLCTLAFFSFLSMWVTFSVLRTETFIPVPLILLEYLVL